MTDTHKKEIELLKKEIELLKKENSLLLREKNFTKKKPKQEVYGYGDSSDCSRPSLRERIWKMKKQG
jgi:archaellum component FlaC